MPGTECWLAWWYNYALEANRKMPLGNKPYINGIWKPYRLMRLLMNISLFSNYSCWGCLCSKIRVRTRTLTSRWTPRLDEFRFQHVRVQGLTVGGKEMDKVLGAAKNGHFLSYRSHHALWIGMSFRGRWIWRYQVCKRQATSAGFMKKKKKNSKKKNSIPKWVIKAT